VLEPKNLKKGDMFYYYSFEYYGIVGVVRKGMETVDFCWYFIDGRSLGDCLQIQFSDNVWKDCIPCTPLLKALL
jgi:hypothetical protein